MGNRATERERTHATTLDGQLLSVPRSLLRYSVLGAPWCLNGAPLPMGVVRDVVAVTLRYGFDLGFASAWRGRQFQFAPDQVR